MTEQPRLKRHFWVWVVLIALALIILGSSAGSVCVILLQGLVPLPDEYTFLAEFYLSFIGIDAVVLIFCWLWEKDLFRNMLWPRAGGASGNTLKMLLLGLLAGFLLNGACILAAWLHGDIHLSLGAFRPVYLLIALAVILIQSGAEELLTRGYILGALGERYPVWVAVGVNSLFFAALHLFNDGVTLFSILNIVVVGVALSLVALRWNSLWMCIGIHTAWNFTQNILFGLPNSGLVSQGSLFHLEAASGSLLYDAVFGVEGGLMSILVMIPLGALTFLVGRKKQA